MRRLTLTILAVLITAITVPLSAFAAAPEVASFAINDGAPYTNTPHVQLSADATNADEMQFSFDAGTTWTEWETYATTTDTVLPDGDGVRSVLARFRNVDGTTETDAAVFLDTVTPTSTRTMSSNPNAAGWYRSAPSISFGVPDEATATVRYWWNTDPFADFVPKVTAPFAAPSGINTLSYLAFDPAGNMEETQTVDVKVDNVAPTVSASEVPNGWSRTPVTVTLSGDDMGGSGLDAYHYEIGAVEHEGQTIEVTENGTTDLAYWTTDVAGNKSALGTARVMVDSAAPSVSASGIPSGWSTKQVDVTFDAEDGNGSGVDSIRYRLNGTETTGSAVTIADEGTSTLEFWAVDVAGNSSNVTSRDVRIDRTVPTVVPSGIPLGWSGLPATISLTASDAEGSGLASVHYEIDGIQGQGTLASVVGEGDHSFTYWAVDEAGNESPHVPNRVMIDTSAPATTDDALATYEGAAVINLSATDSLAGVAKTEWRVDSGDWNSGRQALVTAPGLHTLHYRSVDHAGNTESEKSTDFTVYSNVNLKFVGPAGSPKYNGDVWLTATLTDVNGVPLVGQPLRVEKLVGSTWTVLGTAKTLATGQIYLHATNLTTARKYRVIFAETVGYRAAATAVVTILPKARLHRSTSWGTLRRNRTYVAKGTIEPSHAKSDKNKLKIRAYKKASNGTYRYVKSFTATYVSTKSGKTTYTAKVKLTSKGTYKLVAYHAADSRNAATSGSADYVKVK